MVDSSNYEQPNAAMYINWSKVVENWQKPDTNAHQWCLGILEGEKFFLVVGNQWSYNQVGGKSVGDSD